MSRAHMLYDDQPLEQEAVRSSRWRGKWEPLELQRWAVRAIRTRTSHDRPDSP